VFAPLAARLLCGEPPAGLGPALSPERLVRLGGSPVSLENGLLRTWTQHVDRFGNAVLALEGAVWRGALRGAQALYLESPVRAPLVFADAYAALSPTDFGLIEGSQGYFEIAMNQKSAAQALGLAPGREAVIRIVQKESA